MFWLKIIYDYGFLSLMSMSVFFAFAFAGLVYGVFFAKVDLADD